MAWQNAQVCENWKFKQEDTISHHLMVKNTEVLAGVREMGTLHMAAEIGTTMLGGNLAISHKTLKCNFKYSYMF